MSDMVQPAAAADAEEGTDSAVAIAPPRTSATEQTLRIVVPIAMLVLAVIVWHFAVVAERHPEIHPAQPRPTSPTRCSPTGRRCCRRSG